MRSDHSHSTPLIATQQQIRSLEQEVAGLRRAVWALVVAVAASLLAAIWLAIEVG